MANGKVKRTQRVVHPGLERRARANRRRLADGNTQKCKPLRGPSDPPKSFGRDRSLGEFGGPGVQWLERGGRAWALANALARRLQIVDGGQPPNPNHVRRLLEKRHQCVQGEYLLHQTRLLQVGALASLTVRIGPPLADILALIAPALDIPIQLGRDATGHLGMSSTPRRFQRLSSRLGPRVVDRARRAGRGSLGWPLPREQAHHRCGGCKRNPPRQDAAPPDSLQRLRQRVHRSEAAVRVVLETPAEDPSQRRRDAWCGPKRVGAPTGWTSAGQRFEQAHTERILVRQRRRRPPAKLFWRRVGWRSPHGRLALFVGVAGQ